ncbi:ankyrin repeat and EF-hand domain-containing protein 1-like isoform X1 [Hydractinia symbiolongicarpus]|uniref:ankyrin repeat and EF-hand domain-containing protein 1-like isoform X1 n=1 Tax=Hydractinia symbiolongicarpus TaxID=13093 RepID=UPI00254F877E|nr:ankyrin repeat and EF-hand domain-containing protein 1-like isoform X1 [Hydractinia symbiolongicarpus]
MPVADDRLSKLQSLKLIQAVNEGDIDQVKKLVENGIPNLVNYGEPNDGQCGLHVAASANSETMIKTLVELGADCNVADKHGKTPFIRAAEFGHVQALNLLIELCEKPDLSAKESEGRNILYFCLCPTKRHQICLETAIKYGAYIHNVGHDGKSLLVKACEERLEKVLKTLLEAGIDVNKQSELTGEPALHYASKIGYEEGVRLLLKYGANPNLLDENHMHAVHKAATNGHLDVIRILSAYGADVGTLNIVLDSPMHCAAMKGYAAICKFLGQRGCSATTKNSNGMTPRAIAKEKEYKSVLKEIKKAEKYDGKKPGTQLHIVKFYDWIIEQKKELESEIFEHDVEVKGKRTGRINIETFLMILIAHKSPLTEDQMKPILKLHDGKKDGNINYELFFIGKKYVNKFYLVGGGKKKRKEGGKKGSKKKGKTKIEMPICTNANIPRIKDGGPFLNYLQKQEQITDANRFDRDHQPEHPIQDDSIWYCYRPETTFVHINEVIKYNDKRSLKIAIKNGLEVNQHDKYYKTPLMLACLEGNIEFVKYLLQHGADVTALDNFKWTPLHFACHIGHKDIVELLLNNGANIDARSYNGGTPMMRAIESSKADVVQLLIERGAKIQVENKKGQTALDIAKAFSDPRIISIVQTRWDELPPPVDKRKKKGGNSKKNTKPKSSSTNRLSMPNIRVSDQNDEAVRYKERDKSLLRAASALAEGQSFEESIVYTPKRAWMPESNTNELLAQKKEKRDQFGYEIDFSDYKPPFQKHIDDLVKSMEKSGD